MKKRVRRIIRSDVDSLKQIILDFLRREALQSHYWFTSAQIAAGVGHSYAPVKRAIVSMASEGFINLRDGDTDNIDFHVALKKSLREVR
jgi:DNA-binding GntR family transcriptional regulator